MTGLIKAGVIGHPITHSKSPLIHGYWLSKYKINGEYKAYDIAPEDLSRRVEELRAEGLAGFNVTLPHKEKVMALCTTLNDEAQRIGAVNTVVFYPDNVIEGRNTDAYGFISNLRENYPSLDLTQRPATIIGAGGAARAVAYALKKANVPEVRIFNRTLDKAETLAEDFGLRVHEWKDHEAALAGTGLLVNTTSLGMEGAGGIAEPLTLRLESLPRNALVYDLVYKPLMTYLLVQAQARGNPLLTGIGMLLHQARPGFQAWFGETPEVDEALLKKVLS